MHATDKTCGTCLCGQQPSVWCSCSDQVKPASLPACGDYAERADSVELAARDMLEELRIVVSVYDAAGMSLSASLVLDAMTGFRDRLHALGVEP